AVLHGRQGAVAALAYHRGGDILASASWDGTTRLWEPRSNRLLLTVPGSVVRCSSDGRRFGFRNGTQVGLWELAEGRACRFLLSEQGGDDASQASYGVDFSPGGETLATAGAYGVRFWDPASGRQVQVLAT